MPFYLPVIYRACSSELPIRCGVKEKNWEKGMMLPLNESGL
jgi:hypothetical protein